MIPLCAGLPKPIHVKQVFEGDSGLLSGIHSATYLSPLAFLLFVWQVVAWEGIVCEPIPT
jgi:hypothetical protein